MTDQRLCPSAVGHPLPDSNASPIRVWLNQAVCPPTALERVYTGTGHPLPDLSAQGTGAESKTWKSYIRRQRLGLSARARAAVVHPHPCLPFSVSPETWGTTTGEPQTLDTLRLAARETFAVMQGDRVHSGWVKPRQWRESTDG
jgi:hypothetical protein